MATPITIDKCCEGKVPYKGPRWEYKAIGLDGQYWKQVEALKYFGNDGWELVSVSKNIAYFKRKLN